MRYAAICLVLMVAACSGSSETDGGTDAGTNGTVDAGPVDAGPVDAGPVDAGSLFATIYKSLGINPHKNYYVGSRPIPLVNPGVEEIKELLV